MTTTLLPRNRTRRDASGADADAAEVRRLLSITHGRHRAVFDGAATGMFLAAPGGELLEANPAFAALLGHSGAEAVLDAGTLDALSHPDDAGGVRDALARTESSGLDGFRQEARYLCASGEHLWLSVGVSVVTEVATGRRWLLGVARDVTERRAAQRAVEAGHLAHARRATHDALTGLPNRDHLIAALESAAVDTSPAAVVFLDLDGFKIFNASLGHALGDQLLIEVAARLRDVSRASDLVARFGGDEFVVLVRGPASPDEPRALADRLARSLEEPFIVGGRSCFLSAGIGIAWNTGGRDGREVIAAADTALYRAKERGRGQTAVFDSEMRRAVRERHEIETGLHYALQREEFRLHYQPIIEIASGRVSGHEALLRWRRDDGVLLDAPDFIPIAEDAGLIDAIGRWVTTAAARQLAAWGERTNMSINVSPTQLRRPDLVGLMDADLARAGISPASLTLEITESVMLDRTDPALANLVALREMGIRIALDDFGTGYSSLTYLTRLPLDVIKIDQSFTRRITTDPQSAAIIRMIVQLADTLGHTVVAEGVESTAQLERLRALGCHRAQGFLFAPPLPPGSTAA